MNKSGRIQFLLQLTVVSMLMLAPLGGTVSAAPKAVISDVASAGFRYSTNTGETQPLIHYQQNVHLLAGTNDHAWIKVFGSGLVQVHYPVYMKRAGDYTMQLDQAELVTLLRSMSSKGVMDFDEKKAKKKIKEKRLKLKQRGELYEISDAMDSIIDIQLDEYQKNSSSKKIKKFTKRFKWQNLEQDAKRYKDDASIVKANEVVETLRGLMKDSRLTRQGK